MDIDKLENLPSPPGVAIKLLELFSAPEITLDELNEVISVDPSLTARIIKYANSPMFARRHEAQGLMQAITMLGANGVKMIALSFSLTEVKAEESNQFDFNSFWNSSLATAVCNQNLFAQSGQDKDTGFLVGLLSNIGQVAFLSSDPVGYEKMMSDRSVFDLELIKMEQEKFNADRYAISAEVLKKWNFPSVIVDALEKLNDDGNASGRCLKLANRMSYVLLSESPIYQIVQSINNDLSQVEGIDPESTEEFFAKTHQNYSDVASILSYSCPQLKTIAEIEMEAKTRMVEMTLAMQQATEQVAAENDELKGMAFVDSLTQLGNRRQYERVAEAELERCGRVGKSFGLIVIDIDHFKKVNDTYGHAAGDAILAGVARELEHRLRKYDSVFRYGGEEFVVVLPESDLEICGAVAERLREAVEGHNFSFEGTEIPVTISLGGAIFSVGETVNLETLFKQADEALYAAKKSGRNRYLCYNQSGAPMPNLLTKNDSLSIPTNINS